MVGRVAQSASHALDSCEEKSFVQSVRISSSDEELSYTTREARSGLAAAVASVTSNLELQAVRSCASYQFEVACVYYRSSVLHPILTQHALCDRDDCSRLLEDNHDKR